MLFNKKQDKENMTFNKEQLTKMEGVNKRQGYHEKMKENLLNQKNQIEI